MQSYAAGSRRDASGQEQRLGKHHGPRLDWKHSAKVRPEMWFWKWSLGILPAVCALIMVVAAFMGEWGVVLAGIVPITLWLGYLLARRSGAKRRNVVRDKFEELHQKTLGCEIPIIEPVGGAYWDVTDGKFERLIPLYGEMRLDGRDRTTGSDRSSRLIYQDRNQLMRIWGGVLLPLLIPVGAWLGDSPDAKDWIALAQLMVLAGFFLPLAVIGWEIAYQRGYQRIWGSMVLDTQPMLTDREAMAKHAPHGDADDTGEARAVGAASGNLRRSKVHDQRF